MANVATAVAEGMPSDEQSFRLTAKELLAGATAGFAEHFVMFPFDTLKTRIQSGKATSVSDACRHLELGVGVRHLYRGCVPVLVSAVPAHAAYFGSYEASKRVLGDGAGGIGLSASLATVAHDTVTTPFDVVKQRMQMDGTRRFRSSWTCCRHIIGEEGVYSLFRSLPTTIMMNVPHFATYWLVYESLMSYAHNGKTRVHEEEATVEYLVSGFVAGGLASVASFPLDTVKTRIQLGYGKDFRSILKSIISQGGVRGMFAGVLPRIMYTAPSGAIMMVTYETTKSFLSMEERQA